VPAWRVYYDDGSTFDSTQGRPDAAPGLGVQAIVQADERVGRAILTRFDWYYWREDLQEWWASDLFGLLDQLTSDTMNRVRAVRAGRNAAAYDAIMSRAQSDPDFPVKSARLVGERG
jgi:hypothetical protein